MRIAIIAGARPNFMKVAPLCKEIEKNNDIHTVLINTGQHFSKEMSKDFFDEFDIYPDYDFNPSRDSVIRQMTDIMKDLEEVFLKEKIDLVLVVGDVNSTLAGALVANKMGIKLAHIEAGLRSYNQSMPEEHNRVVTDHLSDFLFVTSEEGIENLKKENIAQNIFFVGNIMIDTLVNFQDQVGDIDEDYYFCTLHRAENVDNKERFSDILDALEQISQDKKIYLPLHHRTKKRAEEFGFLNRIEQIFHVIEPLSYSDCLKYQKNASLILTDSGGIQEESSFLGIPCITLRTETERPITVELGTSTVGGVTKTTILAAYQNMEKQKKEVTIPFWDGKASKRIINILKDNRVK